jgi:dihydrofolate synthase/folylpolyglutamate synthase
VPETPVLARDDAPVSDDEIAAGQAAVGYVNGLIQGAAGPTTQRTFEQSIQAGERRLARFRRFLDTLGNPQDGLRCLHVGGTSGKGSVAAKLAAGLSASGLRTGLHCTPYLQTALEKFECDGQLARPSDLVDLIDWIRPYVDRFAATDPDGPPTYGMVWVALTLEYFVRARVDIAVMEVGAGGRFDLSNIIQPDLAIITSVGRDHLKSLGGTLESVAWHKAGIFKRGAAALCGPLPPEARPPVREAAAAIDQPLIEVPLDGADFRSRNSRLAEAALEVIGASGSTLSNEVRQAVARGRLAGRFERMPGRTAVYLDGAHNRDKARALGQVIDGAGLPRPRVGIIGMVGYRAASEVLPRLLPQLDCWVATEPQVYRKPALPVAQLAAAGDNLGQAPIARFSDVHDALLAALDLAGNHGSVVAGGSVYLAGNLRAAWYPTLQVIRERTMWPQVGADGPHERAALADTYV